MPDPLLHYSYSILIARVLGLSTVESLLAGLAGIVPDFDALLHAHRGPSHSMILPLMALIASVLLDTPRILQATLALYLLHIAVDAFTGPTPLLWPLSRDNYMVEAGIIVEPSNPYKPQPVLRLEKNPQTPGTVEAASGETILLLAASLAAVVLAG